MKRLLRLPVLMAGVSLPAALGLALFPQEAAAQWFAPNSVLKSGKWVRVDVDRTGLFELSYDQLRDMGFQDPGKVAVFGRGGMMSPIDFTNQNGTEVVYYDDLQPVSILRGDDKIYFYGRGPENHSLVTTREAEAISHFTNNGLNIYSRTGAYFLTDSAEPRVARVEKGTSDQLQNSRQLTSGYWKAWHEEDLQQGAFDNGQLFWGETIRSSGTPRREWSVELPGVKPSVGLTRNGVLLINFYVDKDFKPNAEDPNASYVRIKYGLQASNLKRNEPVKAPQVTYFTPSNKTPLYGYMAESENDTFFVEFPNPTPGDKGTSNLDWWIVTYERNLPTLANGRAQDYIVFPLQEKGTNHNVAVADARNHRVLQITDPSDITELQVTDFGPEGRANFTAAADNPTLLFFDPSLPQLQVCGYERVDNQDLHSLAQEGADLAIITLPHLRHCAEALADVHRAKEGLKVVVVNAPDLYNEFSAGVPDPMAYRAFVTMMRNHPTTPVKNVLFYGTFTNDLRGMVVPGDPQKSLIARQDNWISFDSGALPNFDFAGCTAPYISNLRCEQQPIDVGVGILTVENETDAETIRQKVEAFLADESWAYRLNKMVSVGGIGDLHTHDNQSTEIGQELQRDNFNGFVVSNIPIDAYGEQKSFQKLVENLEEGTSIWQYFGHGSSRMLGKNGNFFTTSRIESLHNTALPFIGIAGCTLSQPDRNHRGLAEALVLNTVHGGIGVLSSSRTSWSGQNMELMRPFYSAWNHSVINVANSAAIPSPLTLGEIYARTKDQNKLQNALAYLLIADPAITFPCVNRIPKVEQAVTAGRATVKAVAGNKVELSGRILSKAEGTVDKFDTDFNGEIVLRLLEPALSLKSQNVASNDTAALYYPVADRQASMAVGKVNGGRFSVELPIPAYLSQFEGKNVRVALAAYNPGNRLAAAGEYIMEVGTPASEGLPAEEPDTQAPVITEFCYDPRSLTLRVTATDDRGLDLSSSPNTPPPFTLEIDGEGASNRNNTLRMGEDNLTVSREIYLPSLAMGSHRATVKVSDAAGNKTQAECIFEVVPAWSCLELELEGGVADGEALFRVSGLVDDRWTLVVLDAKGNEVYAADSTEAEIKWDCTDSHSQPLAPGRYRAFVRESGSASHKAHSKTITVPVI